MPDKYSQTLRFYGDTLDFNFVFLLLTPFWLSMVFINAKVMIEINREWGIDEQQQFAKLTKNEQ